MSAFLMSGRFRVTARVALLGLVWTICLTVSPRWVEAQNPSMPMNMPGMQHDMSDMDPNVWRMPPMEGMDMSMMPYLEGNLPTSSPFMPGADLDDMQRSMLPEATRREVIELADGDVLELEAGLVRRSLGGRKLVMYAFNGQYPFTHIVEELLRQLTKARGHEIVG